MNRKNLYKALRNLYNYRTRCFFNFSQDIHNPGVSITVEQLHAILLKLTRYEDAIAEFDLGSLYQMREDLLNLLKAKHGLKDD